MAELAERRSRGKLKRVFGRLYMDLRRETEAKLRELFMDAGGKPERSAPHYFVLGSSRWYRGLAPDTCEVVLPLDQLPSEVASFTYPDSFTAMGTWPRERPSSWARPYHDRVFRIEQLRETVEKYGLPPDDCEVDYSGYENRPFEKYIEVQLWSDEPVGGYLKGR